MGCIALHIPVGHVRRQACASDNWGTLGPYTDLKLGMGVGHYQEAIQIDIEVIRSMVKVTVSFNTNKLLHFCPIDIRGTLGHTYLKLTREVYHV